MERSGVAPRLIIVCGLPGAGKTTRAKQLELALHAVRFCPDDWMEQLAIDVWDEARRAKIEAFQWNLGQQLLTFGLTVIIEWGTWGRVERDTLRLGARALGAAVELHYLGIRRCALRPTATSRQRISAHCPRGRGSMVRDLSSTDT